LLQAFPQRNWTRRGLDYLLATIDKYGTAERVPGSSQQRTALMPDNTATVEELLASGGSVCALSFALEADILRI